MKITWIATLASVIWLTTNAATFAEMILAGGIFSGRIDRWDPTTGSITTFSDLQSQSGALPGIVGMAYNPVSNRIIVAGRFTNTIYELNATTGVIVGQHTSSNIAEPAGIAVDASGNVYIANNGGNSISRFNSSFTSETTINIPDFGAGANLPSGLAFNAAGELIVATFSGVGVLRYDPNSGSFSSFNATNPVANGMVAIDNNGSVFVGGAAFSNSVTEFDAAGNIVGGITIDSTLLPLPPDPFASPDFTSPSGVAIDGNGNLIVGALGRTNPFQPGDNFQSNGGLFLFDSSGALLSSTVQTTPYSSVMYFSAVPEPTSLLALGVGLSSFAVMRRWKRRSVAPRSVPDHS